MANFAKDEFVATAGTDLTLHTDDLGNAWARQTGHTEPLLINPTSGFIEASLNTGGFYQNAGAPLGENYSVQADFTKITNGTTAGWAGVCLRMQGAANTMYYGAIDDGVVVGGGGYFIEQIKAGTATTLASFAVAIANGATHTLKLTAVDNVLTLFVDGVSTVTFTDTSSPILTPGNAGIMSYDVVTGTHSYKATNFTASDLNSYVFADDANLQYIGKWSPISGSGQTASIYTLSTGAHIEAILQNTETCEIVFDVTNCVSASQFPDVCYQIDGGPWNRVTLTSTGTISCSFPTFNTIAANTFLDHRITIVMEGTVQTSSNIDAWGALAGVPKFLRLAVDVGGSTMPTGFQKPQILWLGDSITQSYNLLSPEAFQLSQGAHLSFAWNSSKLLGFAPVMAGYGGSALISSAGPNSPTLNSNRVPVNHISLLLVNNGVTWTPSIAPTVVVLGYGTNDHGGSVPIAGAVGTGFQNTYLQALQDIRTAWPNAMICCVCYPTMIGSGLNYNTAISAAITASGDSNTFFFDYSGLAIPLASDAVHPNWAGHNFLTSHFTHDIQASLVTAGIAMQKAGSGGGGGGRGSWNGGFDG